MRKKAFEKSLRTHAETKNGLARDLEEARYDMGTKTRECDRLRIKVDKFEKVLATLYDRAKANEERIRAHESRRASEASRIAHFATLLKRND